MRAPCEVVIWNLLPGIRSELAKELYTLGMTQHEISEKLGITQAAVSQYLGGERGGRIKFRKRDSLEIKKLARDIAGGIQPLDLIFRICIICRKLRVDRVLCDIHRKQETILRDRDCDVCLKR